MTRARQTTYRVLGAVFALAGLATSAQAGSWVRGGSLENNEPVTFGRYLAEATEGQMTVRCADSRLSIDAGVAGAGALPEGMAEGDVIAISFALLGADAAELGTAETKGPLRIRSDGAVMVELVGEAATALAELLVIPAETLTVTVGTESRPVTMTEAAVMFAGIAAGCDAWPK